jgi:hypothetical protein
MNNKLKLPEYVQLEKRLGVMSQKNVNTGKYVLMVSGVLEFDRESFDEKEDYANVVLINLEHLAGSIMQFGKSILNVQPLTSKALDKFEQNNFQTFIQDSLEKLKETPKDFSRLYLMLIANTIDAYEFNIIVLPDINDTKTEKFIKINEVAISHE